MSRWVQRRTEQFFPHHFLFSFLNLASEVYSAVMVNGVLNVAEM